MSERTATYHTGNDQAIPVTPSVVLDSHGQAAAPSWSWTNGVMPIDQATAVATDTRREALAAYAHEAWSGWMEYFFKKCYAGPNGTWVIPYDYACNLQALINTPYAALSEEQKDNDRAEADKILALLRDASC